MAEPTERSQVSLPQRAPTGMGGRGCHTERIVMSPDFAWCLEEHPHDCPFSMVFGAAYMCCRASGLDPVAADGKQTAARALGAGSPVHLTQPPPVREEARNDK